MKYFILLLIAISFSKASFAQEGSIMLKNPAKDQVLSGGSYFDIVWEGSNIDNIKIEFSYNGGTTWETVVSSYPVSARKYPWLIPARPTTQGKIRITDISSSTSSSTNTGFFTISQPALSFLHIGQAPVAGQVLPLSWDSRTVAKVNLYYSLDSGSNYSPIIKNYPALAANYLWSVPSIQPRKIRFKVESVDSAQINSIWDTLVVSKGVSSNQKFKGGSFDGHSSATTIKSKINLIYPAGNENLAASSAQNIQWSSIGFEHVKLEFSADSGLTWLVINGSYPAAARKFEWKVPDIVSQKAFIRISSSEDATVVSKNAAVFKIPSKSIALVETDSLFIQGQPIPISWINNGVDNLSIAYRTAGGGWNSIINKLPASNSFFVWVPPASLTSQALQFKLSSSDKSIQDSSKILNKLVGISSSSRKFKGGSYDGSSQQSNIVPTIQILTPDSAAKLNGLAQTEITWKTKNVESIDLSFSSDSGKTWVSVIKNYAGSASKYSWQVPFSPTKNGLVKIISSEDSTIKNVSSRFEITDGFVTITADTLHDGGAQTLVPIKWEQSGMDKVDISYRPAATISWQKIISNYQASAGYFLWIPASKLTGNYLIKLNKSGSSALSDSIPLKFQSNISTRSAQKYKGGSYDGFASRSSISKISITKPQSGEILIIGSKYVISWSTVNVSDSVKIEYSTDNGITWKLITESVDASTGTYEWYVPGVSASKSAYGKSFGNKISSVQNECKIRISDKSSKEVVGFSDNTFMITEMPAEPIANQINFPKITDKLVSSGSFELKASTPSELPLTFTLISGPAVLTGNNVTFTGTGDVKVKVQHPGNTIYKASESEQSFKILSFAASVISVPKPPDVVYTTEPFEIAATVNSGLPLTYEVISGPATYNGKMLTATGTGLVKIRISHPDKEPYSATSVIQEFSIIPATPVITFTAPADRILSSEVIVLSGTSTSSVALNYTVVSGPANVDSDKLTITGAGKVVLKVSDPGNNLFKSTSKNFEFNVLAPGVISFTEVADLTFGAKPVLLSASTNTGAKVIYKVLSGPGILRGDSLVITGAGTITVEASSEASGLYSSLSAPQEIGVGPAEQVLTFPELPNMSLEQSPITLKASSSSGLPIIFTILSGPASVVNSSLTVTGLGKVVVRASTSPSANYNLKFVDRDFSVIKATKIPELTLAPISDRIYSPVPITVIASTTSGFPLTYEVISGPATITGNSVTLNGSGKIVIKVTHPAIDDYVATSLETSFTVMPLIPTINFSALPNRIFDPAPTVLLGSSSSGLPLSFSILSGPAKMLGNNLTLTGTGAVVLRVIDNGNAIYKSEFKDFHFNVFPIGIVNFPKLAERTFGDKPVALFASTNTGLPLKFKVISGQGIIREDSLVIIGAGTIILQAGYDANEIYPALAQSQSLLVRPMDQTITFPEITNRDFSPTPIEINASSTSGLPISFSIVSGSATVSGTSIILKGPGEVTVRATPSPSANYISRSVDRRFTVYPFVPTISLSIIPDMEYDSGEIELSGSTNTLLPLTYSIVSGPAILKGNMLKTSGVGTVVVRVSHNGNEFIKPAYADRTFKVLPGDQQLTFEKITDKTYGDKTFVLFATSRSNQPMKYEVISGSGKVVGNTFEVTAAGSVTIRVMQEASANYRYAAQEQMFKIEQADQILEVQAIADMSYAPKSFALKITKSTDQPATIEIISGPANASAESIQITGVGVVTGRVTLRGNLNYRPVVKEFKFNVNKAAQTIKFDELVSKPFGSAPFEIKAASNSGLPLAYILVSGPATLEGNKITLTGTGLVKIRASQPGNDLYSAAELDHEFRAEELLASNFTVQMVSAACAGGKTGQIKIDALRNLNYTAQVEGSGFSQSMNFTDTLTLRQLAAGKYAICIKIDGASGFEQCFNVVVKEPEDLKMFTSVDMMSNELNILMSGSEFFNIDLNGVKYRTNQTRFTLALRDGINTISLSSDLYCQGIIVKKVLGGASRIVFPNPFKGVLKLDLTRFDEPVNILVIDLLGRTVYRSTTPVHRKVEEIPLSHVSKGALYVKLVNSDFEETFKVFKED